MLATDHEVITLNFNTVSLSTFFFTKKVHKRGAVLIQRHANQNSKELRSRRNKTHGPPCVRVCV